MNQPATCVTPHALWQALSVAQQQQLLALLGRWVLRAWQKMPLAPLPVSRPRPGECHEPQS
jgi:hypothetical protein